MDSDHTDTKSPPLPQDPTLQRMLQMIHNPNYSEGCVLVHPGNVGSNSVALAATTQLTVSHATSASPRSTTSLIEIVTAHHPVEDTLLHQPQDFSMSLSSIDAAAIYSMAQRKQFPQMPFPKN